MNPPKDPFGLAALHEAGSDSPLAELRAITDPAYIDTLNHGDLQDWLAVIESLPDLRPTHIELKNGVSAGLAGVTAEQIETLETQLRKFIPWRKGPFDLFGVSLDTEWDSGMKWERLVPHLDPLAGKRVLDVGCGNGYHCWRALGEGADLVIGLEPYLLYVMQFLAVRKYLAGLPCHLLPLRLEHYPGPFRFYDTVLSMGVIYHVRSPIDHLLLLKNCVKPGGQVVLETLVVEGEEGYSLTPASRYARMSNVWFIPSVPTLQRWMLRCGFTDVRLVDLTTTSEAEQRSTSWMPFQSLADGLDRSDSSRTVEGLPAPRRAIMVGRVAP